MTIGTGTFSPTAKFAFPRSYVYRLLIARHGLTLAQTGSTWLFINPPPEPTVGVLVIDPAFWAWNSNGRSLDHIVTDFYYVVPPDPTQHPLNFSLAYGSDPVKNQPALFFDWFSGAPDFQTFTLPAQPSNYWLPKPLP